MNPPGAFAGALVTSALFGAPCNASADEPPRFTLSYRADASCPDEGEFVRQVKAHSALAIRTELPPSEVQAAVMLEVRAGRARGVVDLSQHDGATHRELDARDCAELARAVALIIALAIDPDARAVALDEGASREAAEQPVRVAPPRAEPALTTRGAQALVPPRSVKPGSAWFGGGGFVGFGTSVRPTPTLYEGVFAELVRRPRSRFAPSVRVSGFRASASATTSAGSAELTLFAARLLGCPFHFGSNLFAEPCVSFDYGRLRGRGYATREPRSSSANWFGPGATLRIGVPALELLNFGLEAGIVAPLARDRFFFGPDVSVLRIPSVAGFVGLTLGFRS